MSDEGYLLDNQASEAGWRLDAVATLFDPSTFRHVTSAGGCAIGHGSADASVVMQRGQREPHRDQFMCAIKVMRRVGGSADLRSIPKCDVPVASRTSDSITITLCRQSQPLPTRPAPSDECLCLHG